MTDERAVCEATTAAGRPCKGKTIIGSTLCVSHAGRGTGRKTKLDSTLTNKLVEMIRAGTPQTVAARAMGVAKSTLYEWLTKGEAGEEPYAEFREQIERARAEGESTLVLVIKRAAVGGDVKAAEWLLERGYGGKWAKPVASKEPDDGDSKPGDTPERDSGDPFAEDPNDELQEARSRRRTTAG